MAEEMFMFAVTAGLFVAFVALIFGARAKRYSSGWSPAEGHAHEASSHES